MPKLPLSPFLLDPDAALPAPHARSAGCPGHAVAGGRRGTMDLDAAEGLLVAAPRAWVAPPMQPPAALARPLGRQRIQRMKSVS
jgi:hypothetical protein